MVLPINKNRPLVMHIDLNSCFASAEQQANPLLRGKPLAIAAYTTPNGCIVAPSREAKTFGIKTGMRVKEGRLLCPELVVRPPDPLKYRDIHNKLKKVFQSYTDVVVPKSIDEAVLEFRGYEKILKRSLEDIGREIKQRVLSDVGEWMTCNVGIGTNRFLAKLAASLHKPDGLDVIDHRNLRDVLNNVTLLDLCGINVRYQARLNMWGIFSPLQFIDAPEELLRKQVFKSINGTYWYMRLRGFEVDDVEFARKSYGQSYALGKFTDDPRQLSKLLMKLVEKMGRRLRRAGYAAQGIHVAIVYRDGTFWHRAYKFGKALFTTYDLYRYAQIVWNQQPSKKVVVKMSVSCYDLLPHSQNQLELFDAGGSKWRQLSSACDQINNRFGEFVITPALMMGMDDLILDRIAFGGVKELEDLYS